jgi:hypothetical protein
MLGKVRIQITPAVAKTDARPGDVTDLGGFATNCIHIGGRYEFPTRSTLRPFVSGRSV